jgi:hypothetical protein
MRGLIWMAFLSGVLFVGCRSNPNNCGALGEACCTGRTCAVDQTCIGGAAGVCAHSVIRANPAAPPTGAVAAAVV